MIQSIVDSILQQLTLLDNRLSTIHALNLLRERNSVAQDKIQGI